MATIAEDKYADLFDFVQSVKSSYAIISGYDTFQVSCNRITGYEKIENVDENELIITSLSY